MNSTEFKRLKERAVGFYLRESIYIKLKETHFAFQRLTWEMEKWETEKKRKSSEQELTWVFLTNSFFFEYFWYLLWFGLPFLPSGVDSNFKRAYSKPTRFSLRSLSAAAYFKLFLNAGKILLKSCFCAEWSFPDGSVEWMKSTEDGR